ncbi:MAG: hypothetical protein KDA50_07905, partial [Rhodobacteraceae bacterium]|nr:hypothetical protein [Paracoccaceae bacterium]
MTMTSVPTLRRSLILGAFWLGLSAVLATLDPLLEGEPMTVRGWFVDLYDKGLLVAMMLVSALVVVRVMWLEEGQARLEADLTRAHVDGEAWRSRSRQLVAGLSLAIETQFADWELTPAEADIAGLLLKGASVKDIATLRRTSQATVRQQAQAIYRKSGLG